MTTATNHVTFGPTVATEEISGGPLKEHEKNDYLTYRMAPQRGGTL